MTEATLLDFPIPEGQLCVVKLVAGSKTADGIAGIWTVLWSGDSDGGSCTHEHWYYGVPTHSGSADPETDLEVRGPESKRGAAGRFSAVGIGAAGTTWEVIEQKTQWAEL